MTDKNLMYEIQRIGFALIEANLYLDAYPWDKDALAYFGDMTNKYKELVLKYEETCGPLTVAQNGTDSWKWTETPWGWELEAN